MVLGNKDFKIYPNPTKDFLTIENKENNFQQIELLDIQGRILISEYLKSNIQIFNLTNLGIGSYFLKLNQNSKLYKIIKN